MTDFPYRRGGAGRLAGGPHRRVVFAVAGAESAAVTRVYETLVGAGVAVLLNAVVALRGMCRTLADRAHGPDAEPIYEPDVGGTLGAPPPA